MALSISSSLTTLDDCDTDNWTGDATVGLDTDFYIEPTGSIAVDVDIETVRIFSAAFTAIDLSANHIYAWMMVMTQPTLDTLLVGGLQIGVEDSSGNQSFWYVGGKDTYKGGWEVFVASTANTPDWNNGTVATLTDIVKVGVGYKCTAKSKLSVNCYVDWVRYGNGAALTITGTNAIADDGWSEVLTLDEAGYHGIIKAQSGSYVIKGPIAIGDAAGTGTTDFSDKGTTLIWADLPVASTHYGITIQGNATGTTDLRLGSVVGTGDDRQGVEGNIIKSAGPIWKWDSQTDIADLDSVKLYGCIFQDTQEDILLDGMVTIADSSLISCTFINCGEIVPGTTSNGAELLSCVIIDPTGATNNRGLRLASTSHNIKKVSLITSGVPTSQNLVHLTQAANYTISFDGIIFYGAYSGTIYQGENSGSNADVIISAISGSGSNPDAAKFQNTNGGTVTVQNSVNLTITVIDKDGNPIEAAQTAVYKSSDDTELMNEDTLATGIAEQAYNYTGDIDVYIRVRKSSTGATKYIPASLVGTVTSTGLVITVTLRVDPNA